MSRFGKLAAILVPYLVLMTLVSTLLWKGREWVLVELATPGAQERWQT